MNPTNYVVPGFDAAGIAAGIKKSGALDLALIVSRTPCRAAATFTQSSFAAAPVLYDKQVLAANPSGSHGVIINSGCANACTGTPGAANTRRTAEAVEEALGAGDHSIFVMSTGVIGVQLPMDQLLAGIPPALEQLRPDGWLDAALAIMTTDTRPKLFAREAEIGGRLVHFTGISKGAGMIHPNMATMLSTIATDAAISHPLLQQALSYAVNRSYNRISVDGDTSTNDTVLLLANGAAGNHEISDANSRDFALFQETLTAISIDLAQAIVRDGEGATKFVTVQVNGARSDGDAHAAANTIATSPLVKTAFFGGDANWGRFVAAAGRSGAYIEQERCSIFIRGGAEPGQHSPELQLLANGTPLAYSEEQATKIFSLPEIDVRLELGLGTGSATVWTTDLSYEYVKINGDYRT
ncbi:MAG: ornithine acetyltransferase [Chloroflexi bacterium]|nr:MAG: ornithine acetyltransferase [Chloroflexota bacterium]